MSSLTLKVDPTTLKDPVYVGPGGYSYYGFTKNDIFVNTLQLYPQIKFLIYNGTSYYNNFPNISGSFTDPVRHTSASNVSLYELNIDRGVVPLADAIAAETRVGPEVTLAGGEDASVYDTGLIYPFVYKDGTRMNLRTSTSLVFESLPLGAVISGSYPLTASIGKRYYPSALERHTEICNQYLDPTCTPWDASAAPPRYGPQCREDEVTCLSPPCCGPGAADAVPPFFSASVTDLFALKNTINYYRVLSPHFEYSSSPDSINLGIHNRSFDSVDVGLVSVPSIIYGSEIKRGTVNLEYYITGTLIARAQDTKRNGELIQTYGTGSLTDTVVGLVLYNEGFLILTSSTDLMAASQGNGADRYISDDMSFYNPAWTYFAQSISGSVTAQSASFMMEMSGTTDTQVLTMFATAPKGKLNHSNNPSYLKYDYTSTPRSGSYGYMEDTQRPIKNVVSSAYADPTGSFEKTTYISKIGLFDDNKNLIAIAKTATPIKKTVERDFTFKLKLDI